MRVQPAFVFVFASAFVLPACVRPVSAPPRSAAPAAAREAAPRAAFAIPDVLPQPPRAPISLTASDGTGLEIAALTARTQVFGPLARTEVHLVFQNPVPRELEGRFRMAIPPRSFVSRLAMKIDGAFREADAAPLSLARDMYEERLHFRRDPLLVEQKDSTEISARVFPIRPHGTREIIVGWTEEIGSRSVVTFPLHGLPRIGRLELAVSDAKGRGIWSSFDVDAQPSEDVKVPAPTEASALRAGDTVVARVRVPGEATPAPIGAGLVVLFDTSASHAHELASQIATLRSALSGLAAKEPSLGVVVLAFDQDVEIVHDGPASLFGDAAVSKLKTRGALGASDLAGAMVRAAGEAKRVGATRALLVGDGVPTAGNGSRTGLHEAVRSLGESGVTRLDAIAVGDVRSESTLRSLVSGVLPEHGVVLDAARGDDVVTKLRSKTLASVAVTVPGATWYAPARLEGVQAGDERIVHASVGGSDALRVVVGGREVPLRMGEGDRALVTRSAAKARVDALVEDAEANGWDDAKRKAVIALATKHKVASPLTGLLVLENDADRRELEVRRRQALAPPPPPKPVASLAGVKGAHKSHAPSLRMGTSMVSGRLPPEVIQRIIRQNFGRFRSCYEDGLRRNPKLRGRVVTKFVIDSDGGVRLAVDGGSDLPDTKVVACVNAAFAQLAYPSPELGSATVVYPIVFRPLDDEDDDAPEPQSMLPFRGYYGVRFGRNPFVPSAPEPAPRVIPPWKGPFAETLDALVRGETQAALASALAAHARDARDLLALVALGHAARSSGLTTLAARAYGSIADLYPDRADLLRVAGVRLEALGGDALPLAIELLSRARDDRPDQPTSHHLLAMALMESGRHAEAFEGLSAALGQSYASRYGTARFVLARDLGLAAAAWGALEPAQAEEIRVRAAVAGAIASTAPSRMMTTSWESDASSVSLEVTNADQMPLGATYDSASDGYGPVAVVEETVATGTIFPKVTFRRRGPTGDAIGVLHLMEHDGRGHVTVQPRPFVLQNEGACLWFSEISPSSGSR